MNSTRRLSFGSVAELYERARPSYPEQLVDDVLGYARADPGDRVLEVGAGTGKATRLFAGRGLDVLALEPSPEMAAVARRALGRAPHVDIRESDFENWDPGVPRFRLVYGAQAWHWVRPEVGYRHAAQALLPDGALAVFWNHTRWDEVPERDALERVYAAVLPADGRRLGPMHPGANRRDDWMTDWDADAASRAGFAQPVVRDYRWSCQYDTEAYLELLRTASEVVMLPEREQGVLLDGVAGVLERNGGGIHMPYSTRLLMARITQAAG